MRHHEVDPVGLDGRADQFGGIAGTQPQREPEGRCLVGVGALLENQPRRSVTTDIDASATIQGADRLGPGLARPVEVVGRAGSSARR